ncbi:MAG: PAS domain-containing protein [Thiolinea sp.]
MNISINPSELSQAWESVERMFAVITFDPQGHILDANPLFFNTMGYNSKDELVGHHHRMFCQDAYAASPDYAEFWNKLGSGERVSGAFRRVRKDASEIFLYAEYAPIRDEADHVVKVLKVAQNVSRIAESMARQLGLNDKLAYRLMSLELDRNPTALSSANDNEQPKAASQ